MDRYIKRDFLEYFERECLKEGIKISKSIRYEKLDEIPDEEETRKSNIDFELIFQYLELLENRNISSDDLHDRIHSIDQNLQKIDFLDDFSEKETIMLTDICKRFLNFMKNQDDKTQRLIINLLYDYTYNSITFEILKEQSLTYLVNLLENGKYFPILIKLLEKRGYFDESLNDLIIDGIQNKDISLLKEILNNIDFSKHQAKRLEMREKLLKKRLKS